MVGRTDSRQIAQSIARRAQALLAGRKSCIVVAPPAFGKTTLLQAMAEQVCASGGQARYLSIDDTFRPRDLDEAAHAVMPHSPNLLAVDVAPQAPPDIATQLERLLAGARVRVAIACREPGRVHALRHVFRGHAILVGQRFLALDAAETRVLFVDAEPQEDLIERCAGWPGALAWLARSNARVEFIGPTTREALLYDYAVSEVFDAFRGARRRRAIESAALGTLDAELLGAVLGLRDLGTLLDELQWIVPAAGRGSDGFCPLVIEAAAAWLERHDPQRLRGLHRRAADWARAAGRADFALHHARLSGDRSFELATVEHVGALHLAWSGSPQRIRQSIDLESDALLDLPRYSLAQVYLLAHEGRLNDAWRRFDDVREHQRALTGLHLASGPLAELGEDIVVLEAVLQIYADRALKRDLTRSLERLSDNASAVTRASAVSVLAADCNRRARYREALALSQHCLGVAGAAGSPYVCGYGYLQAALAQRALGALAAAESSLRTALEKLEAQLGPEEQLLRLLRCVLATVAFDRGDTARAQREFDRALTPLAGMALWGDSAALIAHTALHVVAPELRQEAVLQPIREILIRGGRERWSRLADVIEADALTLDGDAAAALNVLGNIGRIDFGARLSAQSAIDGRVEVRAELVRARAFLASGRPADALACVEATDDGLRKIGDRLQVATADLLRLEALHRLGRLHSAARLCLDRVPELAAIGAMQLLREHAPAVLEAIDWLERSHPGSGTPLAVVKRTLEADENAAPLPRPVVSLSQRQREVLALLADGLSTKEISRRLDIAEGTVKVHRRVLFEKLEASSRSQALRYARELELL